MFFLQKKFFGLDISDLSLKVAQTYKTKEGFVASTFGFCDIPEKIIEKGELKNEQALSKFILSCLKNSQGEAIKTKNVVCSLPEERSFIDVFQVPLIEEKEQLEQVVLAEAEDRIPFPLSEVYYDFEVVGREVILAACPKKIVDPYFNSLKRAGLFPLGMEIESLAIARAIFSSKKENPPTLIVDFGQNKTSFFVFSKKAVRLTSTVPCSAKMLTLNIAQALKISTEKAKALKETEGLCGKQKGLEAMVPILNELVEHIKAYLAYYKSHLSENYPGEKMQNVSKLLLCGGGANLKGLAEFLQEQLKIDISSANPLINFNLKIQAEKLKIQQDKALSLTTALGLSQRNIYED
ncbi:MAG: type IV pilus assembly protein PilM [bacterium]|nr:type IV pilus assembly protein PilM [bacterium]